MSSFFTKYRDNDGSEDDNDISSAIKRTTVKGFLDKRAGRTKAPSSNGNLAPPPHQPGKTRKYQSGNPPGSGGSNSNFEMKLAAGFKLGGNFRNANLPTAGFCRAEAPCQTTGKVNETLPQVSINNPGNRNQRHISTVSTSGQNHVDLGANDDIVLLGSRQRDTPLNQAVTSHPIEDTELQKTLDSPNLLSSMSSSEQKARERVLALKKISQGRLEKVSQPLSLAKRTSNALSPIPSPQTLLPCAPSVNRSKNPAKTAKEQRSSPGVAQNSHKKGGQGLSPKSPSKLVREDSTSVAPQTKPVPSEPLPKLSNKEQFEKFASHVPPKRTTQLVGPLPEPLPALRRRSAQEVEKWNNRDLNRSLHVASKGPRQIPLGQRIVMPEPIAPPPPPPRPPTKTRTAPAQKARQKARPPSLSAVPTVDSEEIFAPDDTPMGTQGVCAEKVLGESGLIFQYVSNRTRFFDPCQTTREAMRVRGSAFMSKIKADEDVRKWFERRVKSVTGKLFSINDGYFSGVVRFANGLEQHFWVSQEIKDLRTLNRTRCTEGKKKLMIDPDMAKVYRERYDVISHRAYPNYEIDKPEPSVIYHDEEEDDGETASNGDQYYYESYRVDENFKHPADFVDWKFEVHNSFVDRECANGYAFKMFETLAKPTNCRLVDKDAYGEFLQDLQEHRRNFDLKKDMADLQWAPPSRSEGYRWEFVKLHIKVHKTQLHGPMDIGDMAVDCEMAEVHVAADESEDSRPLGQDKSVEDRLDADGDSQMSESESVVSEEL